MINDGKIHRIKGASGKSAWYVSHGTWGAWGDWATGEKHTFSDGSVSRDEMLNERIKQRHETKRLQAQVAKECLYVWENKADHVMRHNYLIRKQIKEYAVKWCGPDLLIPMCDLNGKIWNLQRITSRGQKFFVKNGRKKGCMFKFGEVGPNLIVCEGYATAASIHQITGLPVIMAFDAYNLYEVCKHLIKKYPLTSIYIAMDDDAWKPRCGNTGLREALKCYSELHVGLIKPVFKSPDPSKTDFNDLHVCEGKEAVYRQFEFLMEAINEG